jgi:hypothetical protein
MLAAESGGLSVEVVCIGPVGLIPTVLHTLIIMHTNRTRKRFTRFRFYFHFVVFPRAL